MGCLLTVWVTGSDPSFLDPSFHVEATASDWPLQVALKGGLELSQVIQHE